MLDTFDAERMTSVLYALAVGEVDGMVDRFKVRDELDRSLAALASPVDPTNPTTLASWGTSAEAQAAQEAMMRLAP